MQMDDFIRQTIGTLRAMWKHRWLGVAVAWVVGAVGTVAVLMVPNKYEATARIYVDTQSILKPLLNGLAVQPNVDQQINMLTRTLISRPNVEKLIRMADLDLEAKTKEAKDGLADGLIKGIEIKSATPQTTTIRDNLYTISYRNSDPEKAKKVVQSLVSIFVESSMGDARKDSDSARQFIDEQIKVYEQKLQVAEDRLKQFKLRNLEMQMDDGKTIANRFAELSRDLDKARLDLREAQQSRDALKRQLSGEDAITVGGVAVSEIDGRIAAQQQNLDTLLQRYTDQHPDVISARRSIKELEEQKRQEMANRKKGGVRLASDMGNNLAFQQLRISLGEAEANVASLGTRVAEYESRLKRMNELMKVAPQIEAELAQLNRDYDVNKKNYEGLVGRRESASISGNMDSVAGVADFRLIDPPRVAPSPVGPNRTLLLPLVLLVSLAAGAFASFVSSQLRPVYFDSRALRVATGLPLLGSVSLVESESARQKERSDLKRFFVASGGLVVAFAVGSVALLTMSRTVV